jgi:hypothetical protein
MIFYLKFVSLCKKNDSAVLLLLNRCKLSSVNIGYRCLHLNPMWLLAFPSLQAHFNYI